MNILLWIQQATTFILYSYWYNNPICFYTPIDTTIYYVTISPWIQQAITLQYSYWYNNPICYYTSTDTANHYIDTTISRYDTQLNTTSYYEISHATISLYTAKYKILSLLCYYPPIDTTNLRLTYSNWYNKPLRNLLRYYIPMTQQDTTTLFRYWYHKLLWHQSSTDTTIHDVTTLLLIQHATKLLYSYQYSKLLCYYTTIDTTIWAFCSVPLQP